MLWQHREFRKLWVGQTISQMGSRITRQAIPMTAVIVLGASPLEMGVLSGASRRRSCCSGFSPERGWTGCAASRS